MDELTIAPEILRYYERGGEADRLERDGPGRLEFLRTRDVLRRLLPEAPSAVADVGGGMGVHARWLAEDGHRVTLVDPVPSHVDAASRLPGVTAVTGDARRLPLPDGDVDAVLLLGPMYHLREPADRESALAEAIRVVRPGGPVVVATVNRFSVFHDMARRGALVEAGELMDEVAASGHLSGELFTGAYLHRPEEIRAECDAAGLTGVRQFGVEGAVWLIPGLEVVLDDAPARERLLGELRRYETEPSLWGAGGHLLTAGFAPSR
ncbi:ubiquinone/menaquinone biosynthesis C-methylase UbiE [Stackebrandtia albiflava]|uniref:Ubiquinone/menaquinone biosynthesis C-methylase UbiE n=1 Tax=Stackebrandtia albiflava TaxID=406432 RepID=A0A562VDT5_9ACTN|nr:class I SAM-dependent methyltransferase [Stackebrandtia albiflava]TWJ15977.1 ubiquinone/menaquinone biosynthesis C-methylase UbiE [Stackebrandtia albiflava]